MIYPNIIREEELKNLIAKDWFSAFDKTHFLGDIDFSVAVPKGDGDTNLYSSPSIKPPLHITLKNY